MKCFDLSNILLWEQWSDPGTGTCECQVLSQMQWVRMWAFEIWWTQMCVKVPGAVCTRVSGTLPIAIRKCLRKEAQGRKVSFDSSFEGSIYHVRGKAWLLEQGATGHSWEESWTPVLSSPPFYSFWDTSPCKARTTFRMSLLTSVKTLW